MSAEHEVGGDSLCGLATVQSERFILACRDDMAALVVERYACDVSRTSIFPWSAASGWKRTWIDCCLEYLGRF